MKLEKTILKNEKKKQFDRLYRKFRSIACISIENGIEFSL
jgi:hypothetical protein